MSGPEILKQHAGRLRTRMGACFPGSHAVFRGNDLHERLRDLDWVGLYVFGITGRRLSGAEVELLHALWVCTSYPDARLWNNRVAALAASARSSSNLGITAALAVSEAKAYGGQAGLMAMEFLQRAQRGVENGESVDILVATEIGARHIYGYGRPIPSADERIPWVVALAGRLGLDSGVHLKLAFEVERVLLPRFPQLRINYAAVYAALVADMGFSLREYQILRVPTFLAGMAPCAVEAAENPEGTLFPTPCDGVTYEGVGVRSWVR